MNKPKTETTRRGRNYTRISINISTSFVGVSLKIPTATKWIEGEITEEWSFHNRFISVKKRLEETGVIEEDVNEPEVLEETIEDICDNMQIGEKYNAERRTLQILEILKLMTDENHRVNKEELKNLLRHYRMAKYENFAKPESPTTFTSTLESILLEVDPQEYSEEREQDYRIRYEGYKEDRLRRKLAKELKGKGAEITGFSYVHTFSYAQLDALIELVCLTDILSADEKSRIVEKLVGTASEYYESPFWNKRSKKIKFNVKAIHGRFSGRQNESSQLAENIRTIQYAVNNLCQIRFRFNRYTVEKNMTPTSEYMHTLSVYHLVVYHDRYYCIGLKAEDMRMWVKCNPNPLGRQTGDCVVRAIWTAPFGELPGSLKLSWRCSVTRTKLSMSATMSGNTWVLIL